GTTTPTHPAEDAARPPVREGGAAPATGRRRRGHAGLRPRPVGHPARDQGHDAAPGARAVRPETATPPRSRGTETASTLSDPVGHRLAEEEAFAPWTA